MKKSVHKILVFVLTLGMMITGFNFPKSANAAEVAINPVADAYVRDGSYANTNYGTSAELAIKKDTSSWNRKSYVKFNFSAYSGSAAPIAKLRVKVSASGSDLSRTVKLYGTDEGWTETGITWNNAPEGSTYITSQNILNTVDEWYEFDVTSYVYDNMSDKVVSFLFMIEGATGSQNHVNFYSKEAGVGNDGPELVIKPAAVTFNSSADAYVRNGWNADANFGTETKLETKNETVYDGYARKSYVKFDFSDYSDSDVPIAKLRVKVSSVGSEPSRTVKVYGTDESWTETGITWNNAPAGSTYITSQNISNTVDEWYEFDVTSYVYDNMSDKVVSFVLVNEGASGTQNQVNFYSKEAGSGNGPELVIGAEAQPQPEIPQPVGPREGWALTFNDEFEGSTLDTNKWNYNWIWGSVSQHSDETMRASNISVADGVMTIKANKEGDTWYSGMTNTHDKFEQQYGYWEARIKSAPGVGFLTAFWSATSVSWPPEIDFVEVLGNTPYQAYMTHHYAGTDGGHQQNSTFWVNPDDLTEDYHIYGAEWDQYQVKWYIDGELRATTPNKIDVPLYTLLNIHVGMDWTGDPQDNDTRYAYVDWVRIWKNDGTWEPEPPVEEPEPEMKTTDAPKGTPVIDGEADAIWVNAPVNDINTYKNATGQSGTGTFRALWDEDYVYILAEVEDSNLTASSSNPWEHSSVEVFIDQNNGKTTKYESDDAQYRVNYQNLATAGPNGTPNLQAFQHATKIVSGGYVVEMAIPLTSITGAASTTMGLDVQINSSGANDVRFMTTWCDTSDTTYKNTSGFGELTMTLVEPPVEDTAAPTWTDGSVTVSNIETTSLTLNWSEATDNIGVTQYKIYMDGGELATVTGAVYQYEVTGLTSDTTYTFKVEAGDAAGLWSTNGPTVSVRHTWTLRTTPLRM